MMHIGLAPWCGRVKHQCTDHLLQVFSLAQQVLTVSSLTLVRLEAQQQLLKEGKSLKEWATKEP